MERCNLVIPDYGDEDIEEELKEIEEREKQRLEGLLEEVDDILEDRGQIYESVVSELNEEIRRQKNRLDSAQSEDEPRIRAILKELYRERREEHRSNWQDKQSWLERKMELEEEKAQLEDVSDFLG